MADEPRQRDQHGRFVPGWKGGPGRPPKDESITHLTREHLNEKIKVPVKDRIGRRRGTRTVTRLQLFVESQVARAINGDSHAAKNVWERIEGRVPLPIDATGELYVEVVPPDERDFEPD